MGKIYKLRVKSNQDIIWNVSFLRFENNNFYSLHGKNFPFYIECSFSYSCMLSICSINFSVVWITLPHSGHGFFEYFYTKLVDHKYHIPDFSSKWTNFMSYELFSSSNQDIDLKVTFLRFDNSYFYSIQGLNVPIYVDAFFSIHVFFSYVQLTS